jgi:amino acid transporter, AAT family
VPIRIMLFYVGALAVLMSVTQAQRLRRAQPLVQALGSIGIPAAASIMNFVVITSALSSCSSGALFYNARLLMRMSRDGMATRRLGRVNQSHVPATGVGISSAFMLLGVALNAIAPQQAFAYLLAICTLAALWTLGVIVAILDRVPAQGRSRSGPASSFPLPGARSWLHSRRRSSASSWCLSWPRKRRAVPVAEPGAAGQARRGAAVHVRRPRTVQGDLPPDLGHAVCWITRLPAG